MSHRGQTNARETRELSISEPFGRKRFALFEHWSALGGDIGCASTSHPERAMPVLHNGDELPFHLPARRRGRVCLAAGRPGGRLRRGPVLPRALVPVLQRAARGFRPGGGEAHRARHQGRGASVDDQDEASALADRLHLPFPVGYGADAAAVAAATGAYISADSRYLQSTGFLLGPDGRVEIARVLQRGDRPAGPRRRRRIRAVPEDPRVSAPRARPGLLLILLIVAWAVAWPVIKVGVSAVPPSGTPACATGSRRSASSAWWRGKGWCGPRRRTGASWPCPAPCRWRPIPLSPASR